MRLIHGDCREVVKSLAGNSIDSVVTDPPYALVSIQKRFGKPGSAPAKAGTDGLYQRASAGFMGKQWDTGETAFDPAFWAEVLRVLKPGAHLLAFGGTRTYHRLACAIEDAGFEIRDQVGWLYGTGFPKSHDVSKAIDKAAGAEREVVAQGAPVARMIPGADQNATGSWIKDNGRVYTPTETAPATDAARQWGGWGTALKPAWEPIVLARKPLIGTVVENVLAHGTGALNIDGCRVDAEGGRPLRVGDYKTTTNNTYEGRMDGSLRGGSKAAGGATEGRFPANVIHDGSPEVLEAFAVYGERPGTRVEKSCPAPEIRGHKWGTLQGNRGPRGYDDTGSAARFFYCAKANKADRAGSKHPTVKPISLMRYLCRLVTPPGGVVLDPFAGTGTTGAAAIEEGFDAVLIERDDEYFADMERRLDPAGLFA